MTELEEDDMLCKHCEMDGECKRCNLEMKLQEALDALLNYGCGDRPDKALGRAVTALQEAILELQ
jgi:hypothetical protein